MASRTIQALITADAAQAMAEMQAAADAADEASAQSAEAMESQAAAADATSEQISAAMASIEADYAGVATSADASSADVDAALASMKASMAETGGSSAITAGEVDAAMADIGGSGDFAATQIDASMAQISASTALASSDVAVDSGAMAASMDEASASADAAKASFMGFSLETTAIVAGVAAVAGVGYEAIKMADSFDKASDHLAADANISNKAAAKIADGFLNASNTTIYTATAITSAYAGVAGQLGAVEGHALTAAQAQMVMNAAQNLATATGDSLSESTQSLATVMQTYGQKANSAAGDSNILFNAGRMVTGGVNTVTGAVQKLVAGLGQAAPRLGQIGGLLVDLAGHGETGRKAISAVTSGFNALITTSQGVSVAQHNMAADMSGMTGQALALAEGLQDGSISSYDYGQAIEGLGGKQGALAAAFGAAYSAENTAQTKITDLGITVDNTKGKFVGIGSVISQLHAIYVQHGADAMMAVATDDLGSKAAQKLQSTIEAGGAAYNADVKAVEKANAAHEAAEKQLKNLGDEWDEVKTKVVDFAIKLGEKLMPVLEKVANVVLPAIPVVLGVVGDVINATVVGPITFLVQAIETVVGWVEDVVGWFQQIEPGIKSAFTTLSTVITAPFKTAFDLIANLWNDTIGKLSFSIPSWVPGIGGDKFSLPKIPVMDTGGIVTTPTLALLAANNKPEAVMPLGSGGATGGSITVNMYGVVSPQQLVNTLVQYSQQHGSLPLTVRRATAAG
jgi:TP901 family phage tail tape measure protein